jgi:hypothetical protein
MRSFLYVVTILSALPAGAVQAQSSLTATAHVAGTIEATAPRVDMTLNRRGLVRVSGATEQNANRGLLEKTYVTDAADERALRMIWVADGRGLHKELRSTDITELKVLLAQRATDLTTNGRRRITVTKVVASDS